MTTRRIIQWLAGLGALFIVLVLGLALLLPRFLDSQTVRDQVQAFLLTKTTGNVSIGNIQLTWFPRPAVIIGGASVALSDSISGKIQSLEFRPSILGLLRGRLEVSQVKVERPAFTVHFPEPTENLFNLDELESQIRSVIAALAAEIPGVKITVTAGSIEVKIGERPPVVITEVDGSLVAPPDAMALRFSSRANVFDSLSIEETVDGDTLVTKGQIKVDRLRLRDSLASLWPRSDAYAESGDLNLDVTLTSVGLKQIKAEVEGSLPSLGLVRGDRKTVVEGVKFKSVIRRDEGIVSAVIERLNLVSPRMTATGELKVDPASPSVQLNLVGHDLDVSQTRDSALKIAGEIGFVEDLFRYVKGGQIPEIGLQASGQSFAALSEDIRVTGTLRDGKIFASVIDLGLEDVEGQFTVSKGIFEAKQFSARRGKIQGRDGTIRLGLEGRSAPFHLDLMVQSDAAELRALLLRVIQNEGFQKELSRVRDLEGNLSGRLVLGERIDSLLPEVSVLQAAVKGFYDTIPYPISIKAGRFHYGESKLRLDGVRGAVGLSSFSKLTGNLDYNDPRQIEITSGQFSLDLAQTKELQNRFAKFPKILGDIESAQGKLDLTSLSLKGPLDEPSQWNFASAGTFNHVAVKHAKLPAVITLTGGKFRGTPTELRFSDAKLSLLDASLTVDGSLQTPAKALLSLEATGTGNIGAEMTDWLSRQIELPRELMLRSPLQMTKGRVLWKQGHDVAFQGNITVAGGPRLTLDVVRGLQSLEAKEIRISDGDRSARMAFDLQKNNFAFSFNGAIDQKTLERLFQVPPLQGSLIQGDLEVNAFTDAPLRFNARGRLAGRELRLPLRNETATVKFFFLEAERQSINIRSASLLWKESHLSFMGKLLPGPKALQLDMDISADRVAWEELTDLFDAETHREGHLGIPLPPVEGTLRLKADRFTIGGFSSNPLEAAVSLSPGVARGKIQRAAVCGIGTSGRVDFIDGEIALDLSVDVTEGQLQSTSRCLTNNRHSVTGSYTLRAQVRGQGEPEKLLAKLRGQFDFRVRDGEFSQSATVDTALETVFDYLNEKHDAGVAFPDLDRESFPFRSFRAHGTLDGATLVNRELAIQSTLYVISGTGKIDLADRQIDARGLVTARVPGNNLLRWIPLVGSILDLGGSLIGIPVRVIGPLENPTITYLAPADVGAELLDIPMRILGLPLDAIRLFTPRDMRTREDR